MFMRERTHTTHVTCVARIQLYNINASEEEVGGGGVYTYMWINSKLL